MAEVTQQIILEYIAKTDKLQADLDKANQQTEKLDQGAKDVGKTLTEEVGNKGGASILKLNDIFKTVAITMAAVFSVKKITDFLVSCTKLAEGAQEIRIAFNKLNNPLLLSELRKATEGTLSDIKLMGIALKANNLGVPLERLGKIMEFAKIRADELGKSTQEVADSIIQGIGTKSTRALVQVGIGQKEFTAKVKETGTYYTALDSIIDKTLDNAGPQIDSAADKQERLRANIENTKEEIGQKLLPVLDAMLFRLNQGVNKVNDLFQFFSTDKQQAERLEKMRQGILASGITVEKAKIQYADLKEELDLLTEQYGDLSDVNVEQTKLFNKSKAEAADRFQWTKLTVQVLDEYIKAQENANKKTGDANTEEEKQAKTFGDVNHQTEQFVQTIKNGSPALNAWATAYIKLLQTNPDNVIETKENIDALADALVKLTQVTTTVDEDIKSIGKSTKDAGKDTEDAKTATDEWILSLQTISELSALISDFNKSKTEEELAALEDRNAQGRISDEAYARQRKAILQKQAEEDKKNAIFKATLAVPVAILSAIPEGPFAIAAATLLALAQLAKIAATDIPKFAGGIIDLQGPGTGTSDSIPAKLSRGESVMTAEETKLYKPVLNAMRNNSFEDYIMRLYLPKMIAKNGGSQASFDDFNIVKATHENTQALNKNFSRLLNKFDSNNSIRRNY